MKENVREFIDSISDELRNISNYILENPELGFEEYKASKILVDFLKKYGFKVEENFLDFTTAFRATYDSNKPGPTICYLSEYDALPDIGHGCGHNMIATTGVGAGVALKQVIDEIGGRVIVLGTPAEETSGVKVDMVNEGVFKDIDVAMMVHPSLENNRSGKSLAMCQVKFIYKGKPAHAASMPFEGVNALDACIQTFNGINALREHIYPTSRIHGIILEGGVAVNVVPERAVSLFCIRSPKSEYRQVLKEKVIACAKHSAAMMGAEVEVIDFGNSYDDLVTNENLSQAYINNMEEISIDINDSRELTGSLDMGNVSQVCPSIHPYFGIFQKDNTTYPGHSEGFRDATRTDYAFKSMLGAIYGLATTGIDVIRDEELLNSIKEEFRNNKN